MRNNKQSLGMKYSATQISEVAKAQVRHQLKGVGGEELTLKWDQEVCRAFPDLDGNNDNEGVFEALHTARLALLDKLFAYLDTL